LLERAQGGDGTAFAALVRAFDPKLRGLAFGLLGDRELMDDVLQEAYLRAFRALPGFEGRSGLGTWLYRITYNACLDELRRRRRRRWVGLGEAGLDETPAAPEDLDERLARASAVREAVAGLKPEERAKIYKERAAAAGIGRPAPKE
jgi:RNA polymerase sigma-70 factor (ECF subfamily)